MSLSSWPRVPSLLVQAQVLRGRPRPQPRAGMDGLLGGTVCPPPPLPGAPAASGKGTGHAPFIPQGAQQGGADSRFLRSPAVGHLSLVIRCTACFIQKGCRGQPLSGVPWGLRGEGWRGPWPAEFGKLPQSCKVKAARGSQSSWKKRAIPALSIMAAFLGNSSACPPLKGEEEKRMLIFASGPFCASCCLFSSSPHNTDPKPSL